MAKAVKVLCDRCEQKITAGVSFCDHCGVPTRWATHEERTRWEVGQWKTADRSHAPKADAKGARTGRRWNPFGRKQEAKPALTLVATEARAAAPAAAAPAVHAANGSAAESIVITVPEAEPVRVAVEPVPAPVAVASRPERAVARPKPVAAAAKSTPAPTIAPRENDAEPIADTPATVMAMRLLNARVRELDEKIHKLERELEENRRTK